jgi:hypothetical protein
MSETIDRISRFRCLCNSIPATKTCPSGLRKKTIP